MQIIGDFNTSVRKALEEIDPKYEKYSGLVVCGTHTPHDVENTLQKIKETREADKPLLGICMGFQLMGIEYARNVLGIHDATSEEFGVGTYLVKKLPSLRVGMRQVNYGGEMRMESHWHNYYLPRGIGELMGESVYGEDDILELVRLKNNKFALGVQFHPEYQSSKDKPHPLLVEFLKHAKMAV